ncbi:uncharacterized protein LOC114931290 [Nylanderia fulva]|uniref:uncharacterized protein LOC114931290 n=1 Tax=Nylanderia fulva TaxID=613905 RepID=UPI0010FB89CE|nr:uncharacterized protein LOC114931290 [Nylanderia fulva]
MVVKNQCFIILLMTLSLLIGNSNAGWKFWKNDKDTTTTTTTAVSVNTQNIISEYGADSAVLRPNIPGTDRGNDQSHRQLTDLVGVREPSQNQPSKIPHQGLTINSHNSRLFTEGISQSAASHTSIINQSGSRSTSLSANIPVESTQSSVTGLCYLFKRFL